MEAAPEHDPWWVRWRYPALVVCLLVVLAGQVHQARWTGDFWLHAATVEATADDPWSPHNPTQSSDAASPMISPYTVAVGLAARLTGTDGVTALGVAGLVLVAIFCALLPPVVRALTGNRRAPFWALLGTIVLWGADPLRWSGYLNLTSLVLVAPYPAMAAWCTVLTAAWATVHLSPPARGPGSPADHAGATAGWATLLAAAGASTVVVHPISAMALVLLVGSLLVGRWEHVRWRPVLAATAAAGVLVAAWPAYRVWDLAAGGGSIDEFHDALYDDLLARAWPLLLAVPVLVVRARRSWRDPLVLAAASSGAAVALGAVAGMPTLGRLFPLLGFAAHSAIGDGLGRLEVRAPERPPAGAWRWATWAAVATLVAIGVVNVRDGARYSIGRGSGPAAAEVYAFARPLVGGDDVVLAPLAPAAYLAGLGEGRPVATVWEERLSPDDADRRADVTRFFDDATSDEARAEILTRWDVDVVVVDRSAAGAGGVEGSITAAGGTPLHDGTAWSVWAMGG